MEIERKEWERKQVSDLYKSTICTFYLNSEQEITTDIRISQHYTIQVEFLELIEDFIDKAMQDAKAELYPEKITEPQQ